MTHSETHSDSDATAGARPANPLFAFFAGAGGKVTAIGVVILSLLVPLGMTGGLISERQVLYQGAVREIGAQWGLPQLLQGPFLQVPYRVERDLGRGETKVVVETAYLLPETLSFDIELVPEIRSRGPYDAVVYTAAVSARVIFAPPQPEQWDVDGAEPVWDRARVTFVLSDLRGLIEEPRVTALGETFSIEPASALPGAYALSGQALDVKGLAPEFGPAGDQSFALDLTLSVRGSEMLRVAHMARQVEGAIKGPWPDPSFTGAYLPQERRVSESGFEARWSLPFFGRPYGQVWTTATGLHFTKKTAIYDSFRTRPKPVEEFEAGQMTSFGVTLLQPVTVYRELQRVVRYGLLFIATTFAAVFLFEILTGLRAHIVHYGLIGLAVVLFYALVLALAELLPFGLAYSAGAALVTAQVSLYVRAIAGAQRAGVICAGLVLLYAVLYVILQMEDYALLTGAVFLFAALSGIMWATRKVNWYATGTRANSPPSA